MKKYNHNWKTIKDLMKSFSPKLERGASMVPLFAYKNRVPVGWRDSGINSDLFLFSVLAIKMKNNEEEEYLVRYAIQKDNEVVSTLTDEKSISIDSQDEFKAYITIPYRLFNFQPNRHHIDVLSFDGSESSPREIERNIFRWIKQ